MWQEINRRGFIASLVGLTIGAMAVITGCGGGSSNSNPRVRATTPTETTRANVRNLHSTIARGLSQSGDMGLGGIRNGLLLSSFGANGIFAGSTGGSVGGSSPEGSRPPRNNWNRPHPRMGAFLHQVAMNHPQGRKARLKGTTRNQVQLGRPGEDPSLPDFEPAPSFYYDYYLELWVQIADEPGKSLYLLYEDEAKTLPAGKIETIYPADWERYPQEYRSTFEYNGGYLAGSYGSYTSITNADYSGRTTYENVYSDGWKDKGSSNWTAAGDYSWTSRFETPDGTWTESSGTFRANGSGGTRTRSSNGYEAVYTYNADGSGRGRITGPDPGLPVTITWDAYGNTRIVYADGTVEEFPGWGYYEGREGGGGTGAIVTGNNTDDPTPGHEENKRKVTTP